MGDSKTGFYYFPTEPAVTGILPEHRVDLAPGDPQLIQFFPSDAVLYSQHQEMSRRADAWRRAWIYEYEAAWAAMTAADDSTMGTLTAEALLGQANLGEAERTLTASDAARDEATLWMNEFDSRHATTERLYADVMQQVHGWIAIQQARARQMRKSVPVTATR